MKERMKKKMKILIATHYFLPHKGGIEFVAYNQAKELVKKGHKVTIVSSKIGSEKERETIDGIKVIRVKAWNIFEEKWGIPYPVFSPNIFKVIKNEIKDADIVHVHDLFYLSSFAEALVSKLKKKPLILMQHVGIIKSPRKIINFIQWIVTKTYGKFILKNAKKAIVCNPDAKNSLKNIKFDKIVFIPHPIYKYKNKVSLGKTNFILYYCSPKLPVEKGLDIAIEFWRIYSKRDNNKKLEIVGISKQDSLIYLKKKGIKLPPNIYFLGELSNKDYIQKIKSCYFMINTARVEEFGKSILECLAKGKVIFTTPTTGAKEIIGKNNSVLISKDFSHESLIETIKNFEKKPNEININFERYLYTKNKNKLKEVMENQQKQDIHKWRKRDI